MILKTISTVNGPASSHALKKIELLPPFRVLTLTVDSYFDEDTYLAKGNFSRITLAMPHPESIGNVGAYAENWLVTDPDSPLVDGALTVDKSDSLDVVKARAWARIKATRALVRSGDFVYDGGIYQLNVEDITAAVALAAVARLLGQPYSIKWTLKDNSERILSGDQMLAMGQAAGVSGSGAFDVARDLRRQIDAATTVEEVDLIGWPAAAYIAQ